VGCLNALYIDCIARERVFRCWGKISYQRVVEMGGNWRPSRGLEDRGGVITGYRS
jgi:hypothetical protein